MNTEFRNQKHGIATFTNCSFDHFSSVHITPSFLGLFRAVWYAVSVLSSVSNNFPYRNLNPLRNRLLRVIFRMIFGFICIHTVSIGVRIFIRKCPIFMRGRMRQARVPSYVSSEWMAGSGLVLFLRFSKFCSRTSARTERGHASTSFG